MLNEEYVLVGRGSARERRRVFAVAVGVISLSVIGFILALIFQWPSDFVLGDAPDSKVTLRDAINGTVTSIPLVPFLVLVTCTFLVRSARWWGTAATVVLTLLGALFVVGGLGEVTSENGNVPRAVLVGAGVVYALLGLTLLGCGVLSLVAQRRAAGRLRRARPHVSGNSSNKG